MGRFNNSNAVAGAPAELRPVTFEASVVTLPRADSSLMQQAGFALLCLFAVSAYANEFATRLFHVKAYISTVSWVLLPLLLLVSGNVFRGVRDVIGRLWVLFLAWMCLAVPFSVWKGGSVAALVDYVPHGWLQFFYFAVFAISVRHLRRVMLFLIAADFLLLVDCFWGGSMQTGRLEIPDSMFFRNANDLSLQLIIAITQFLYLLYQREVWKRVAGGAGMLAGLVFLFETGARGAFVAMLGLAAAILVLGKHRIRFVLAAVPIAVGALALAPASVFHRITLISIEPENVAARDSQDDAAISSQRQRLALLGQSVMYAVTHPLVGVGPGQFGAAVAADAAREGKQATWLGTHNSYTQVASECGIPALLIYTGVVFLVLRSNLRIYRRAPEDSSDVSALAFCLFAGTLGYAIDTFFFHVAYSSYLPAIAGMSVALRLAVDRRLWT
ncbi:MAG: O-antigen ligase family protein [Acidobacteriia bacterium]|nr:O-antigen ligase family protein [Terriglobia bacterium]